MPEGFLIACWPNIGAFLGLDLPLGRNELNWVVVVVNPDCMPKGFLAACWPNLGVVIGLNLGLGRNELNWVVELARRERKIVRQIKE